MGGGHKDLMLVMRILGIFRCVCPVATSSGKKASVEEIISLLLLTLAGRKKAGSFFSCLLTDQQNIGMLTHVSATCWKSMGKLIIMCVATPPEEA